MKNQSLKVSHAFLSTNQSGLIFELLFILQFIIIILKSH
jgi:hypothetical protein